ncbi:MAG: myo-inositol-1(or 4)-monophosphatase [Verrucomicrobiales bacterium]
MTEAAELRTIAEMVARTVGGEVAMKRRGDFTWSTKSSTSDVVTEIDTWAELAVVEQISALRPGDGFLGEEGTDTKGSTGIRWVIDPVDGTTNLLYDIPGYSVSIAAEVDGVSVAGAVFDPVRVELFSGAVGHGATRNGDAISVSEATDLETALVGTGFSYLTDRRREQAVSLQFLLPAVRDIRRLGGAALDLCAVACGRTDAFYETGLSPWDSAAGALIAAEAGAIVETGDLTWACGPGLAEAFVALLDAAKISG